MPSFWAPLPARQDMLQVSGTCSSLKYDEIATEPCDRSLEWWVAFWESSWIIPKWPENSDEWIITVYNLARNVNHPQFYPMLGSINQYKPSRNVGCTTKHSSWRVLHQKLCLNQQSTPVQAISMGFYGWNELWGSWNFHMITHQYISNHWNCTGISIHEHQLFFLWNWRIPGGGTTEKYEAVTFDPMRMGDSASWS